ncbi:SsrA-binding protein SmpB [Candidatus Curculioniphilus buchneri]|uniref:SsrA-binding protein SmpB n=1 Tax=Candidatus Curculioniphilus buchneri TaxID=690594 RepID=UPI00376EE11F
MITKKVNNTDVTIILNNKKISHKYHVKQKIEAGLVLKGWEVKSLRANKVSISDSYVLLKHGEAYLLSAMFQPLITSSSHVLYDPIRIRKLLLKKRELISLYGYVNKKGYTVIMLSLYWKQAWVKATIGLVQGKKEYDLRMKIKERQWKIDRARVMKYTKP